MPWSMQNPPGPAKNWPTPQKKACVSAANAALGDGGSDKEAIMACIAAAKRVRDSSSEPPEGERSMRVVDLFAADRVLAGDSVRILPVMPNGYWRGGTHNPPITPEVIAQMALNFERRGELGQHQTHIPLNIEHVDTEGRIGTLSDIRQGDDGLYAILSLTDKGKALLGDDAFGYLSPEIVWDFTDPETGEGVGPVVVGCAVTNYPYFGDRTALFSQEAGERWEAEQGKFDVGASERLGDRILAGIRSMFAEFGAQVSAAGSQESEHGQPTGGNDMSDKDAAGQLQIPEEFTQQMESMRAQMEAFRAEIAERDGRITEQAQTIEAQRARIDGLVETNLRARFSRQAEALPHVGAENEGLTDQLMWLHAADDTEGRNHFDFWSNLLQTYEAAMSQSKAFSEVGQVGHRTGGTARARFSTLVAEEAAKRNLVVREGDQNWATLAMEVASSNAELYKQYLVEQRGQ